MTADEMAKARLVELNDLADGWGIGRPNVPALVRYIVYEEISTVMPPCMKEDGFTVQPGAEAGAVVFDSPPGQEKAYFLAYWTCQAKYTPNPRLSPRNVNHAPGMLGMLWDYRTGYLFPCLARLGYQPTEALPSRETFIAQGGLWNGYPPIADSTEERRVHRLCPDGPPSSLMLGG